MTESIAFGLMAFGYIGLIWGLLRMFRHTDEAEE